MPGDSGEFDAAHEVLSADEVDNVKQNIGSYLTAIVRIVLKRGTKEGEERREVVFQQFLVDGEDPAQSEQAPVSDWPNVLL